jgi:hypothetical protein
MKKVIFLLALLLIARPSYGAGVPVFSVDKNGTDQTVPANTLTQLTWPHEIFDTNSNFASNTFTPTLPGKYFITAMGGCSNATSGCSIWLIKNGTAQIATGYQGNATTSAGGNITVSDVLDLAAGDTITASIYDSGTTVSGAVRTTYLSGTMIGTSQWQSSGNAIFYNNGSSGHVGIGSTAPLVAAEANGHIRARGSAAPISGAGVELSYDPGTNIGDIRSYDRSSSTAKELDVRASPFAFVGGPVGIGTTSGFGFLTIWDPSNTALYVNGATNIGIGTNATGAYLTVNENDSPISSLVRANNTAGSNIALSLYALNASSAAVEYARVEGTNKDVTAGAEQGTLEFYTTNAGTLSEQVRIDNTGSVGIGTQAPRGGSKLDVNGTVYVATFAASSTTPVCQNGNVLSSCTSARRFKEKVMPSQFGLKEVLRMKPVKFDLRDHKSNWEKHDFGFVAEDMEKISRLFVTYDDKGTINGVRYMQLTAVNTKAIQELNAVVMKHQAEIDKAANEIEPLIH